MKISLIQRLRNLWRLSEIESLEDLNKKKLLGFFRSKKPAIFIDIKSELEKLIEEIEKNG